MRAVRKRSALYNKEEAVTHVLNSDDSFNEDTMSDDSLVDPNYDRHNDSNEISSDDQIFVAKHTNIPENIATNSEGHEEIHQGQPVNSEPKESSPMIVEPPAKKLCKRRTANEQKKHNKKSHPMLSPCYCSKLMCNNNISEEQRGVIHNKFWGCDYNGRKQWLARFVASGPTKQPMNMKRKRQFTASYYLPQNEDRKVLVCQKMFLRTLGFDKSSKILVKIRKDLQDSEGGFVHGDHRGGNTRAYSIADVQFARDHIRSFNPTISHYRRKHAPNRLYLSPELSQTDMFRDYKLKCTDQQRKQMKWTCYWKIIKSMNISFAKLGEERCEDCGIQRLHLKSVSSRENIDPALTRSPGCLSSRLSMDEVHEVINTEQCQIRSTNSQDDTHQAVPSSSNTSLSLSDMLGSVLNSTIDLEAVEITSPLNTLLTSSGISNLELLNSGSFLTSSPNVTINDVSVSTETDNSNSDLNAETVYGNDDYHKSELENEPQLNLRESKLEMLKINQITLSSCGLSNCEQCNVFLEHRKMYHEARESYARDIRVVKELKIQNNGNDCTTHVYLSADMQKVIMMPRLKGYKSCVFTKRLVCFNETFAPIKGSEHQILKSPIAVMWHEAVMGRNDEDIACSFLKVMKSNPLRDTKHITIWLDNCAAQNKNWTLITLLTIFVNTSSAPNTITLKYFTKGHTFMSADSFHHKIEDQMKRNDVIDWLDLLKCIKNAKGQIIEMKANDFLKIESGLSRSATLLKKKPLLSEVVVAQFRKGSKKWFFKRSHKDTTFEEHDFLKRKVYRELIKNPSKLLHDIPCKSIRGVNAIKKQQLIRNLGPLMPSSRLEFYESLPEMEDVVDLCDGNDKEGFDD